MIGERDDWTPADACRKLVNGEGDWVCPDRRPKAPPIQFIVYPGAYHDFDRPGRLSNMTDTASSSIKQRPNQSRNAPTRFPDIGRGPGREVNDGRSGLIARHLKP